MLRDFTLFTLALPLLWCVVRYHQVPDSENGPTYLITGGSREDRIDAQKCNWAVSIRSRNPLKYFGDNHFCGGTIVSSKAVLTSAHCVVDKRKVVMRPRRLLVVAGTKNRLKITASTRQLPVKDVIVHPKFLRYTETDLAILIVKTEFPDDVADIKQIKLSANPPPYGKPVQIYGWGRIFDRGPYTANIRMARINLLSAEECKIIMNTIRPGAICARDIRDEDLDPCRGDGGGPVVYNDELVAVISWTLGCGNDVRPSLYVDIESNYKWIQDNIAGAVCLCAGKCMFVVLIIFSIEFVL